MMSELQKTIAQDEKMRKFSKTDEKEKLKMRQENGAYFEPYKLDSGNGFSLFSKELIAKATSTSAITSESPIWEKYYVENFNSEIKLPLKNAFEEMIELTNEGKLWHYPIDNEQGCDKNEVNVPFYEHVFLDDYLNEFPQMDVIQEFMALVLNGLSQNSYLSLSEKKEIIFWYKDYFNAHMDIINESLNAERLESDFIQNQSTSTTSTTTTTTTTSATTANNRR